MSSSTARRGGRRNRNNRGMPTPTNPPLSDTTASPIAQFFARYAAFDYQPDQDITSELNRMFVVHGWTSESATRNQNRQRQQAYQDFREALVLEFNKVYGTNEKDIECWKALCRVLNIVPIPETLTGCRKAVKACHINLVDLVDRQGVNVHHFPNLGALRSYTIETEKFFPKAHAKAGGLLKHLLRNILGGKRGGYRGPRRNRVTV